VTADPPGAVAVSIEHYLWFVDQALDDMAAIVRELGDEVANRRPAFEGANSPYVILTHCLGVLAFWGGATVAERDVTRDRAAEFTAHGSVEDLVARSVQARTRLEADVVGLEAGAVPANLSPDEDDVPYAQAKGSVLLHILEELYQHLGQMELTRDLLRAGR
jgi:Protein of unknown function (DUF664)